MHIFPNREQVQSYFDQQYKRVALTATVKAVLTPLEIYTIVKQQQPDSKMCLLESGDKSTEGGRFSVVVLPATKEIKTTDHGIEYWCDGERVLSEATHSTLDWIADFIESNLKPAPQDLPVATTGGLYGSVGYEVVNEIEPILRKQTPTDDLQLPIIHLLVADNLAVVDHLTGKVHLLAYVGSQDQEHYPEQSFDTAVEHLHQLAEVLEKQASQHLTRSLLPSYVPVEDPISEADFISSFVRHNLHYQSIVAEVKEEIFAGEAFQVVLAQRFSCPITATSLELYRATRLINPTPFMYLFDFGEYQISGSSPERLLEVQGKPRESKEYRRMTLHPIAGTRRRGKDNEQDALFAKELAADPKEIAEHTMLVDLARNDIGRVAVPGTVKVDSFMAIQRYAQVMHLVSTVSASVTEQASSIDCLKAVFPAGTLSGAPKVRAMQMIAEREPVRRGPFGGGIGYIGFDQAINLAICIRTAVLADNMLYVTAGAGVVADSEPELEHQECNNKARAVIRALKSVQQQLNNEK